jgi:hypothetical protein
MTIRLQSLLPYYPRMTCLFVAANSKILQVTLENGLSNTPRNKTYIYILYTRGHLIFLYYLVFVYRTTSVVDDYLYTVCC